MGVRVGFVGWRGLVGSVLLARIAEEGDFTSGVDPVYFSTTKGVIGPAGLITEDSNDIAELEKCQIIIACQNGEWTGKIYPQLKSRKWKGYWIDASSKMRHDPDSLIVLDPINGETIAAGLENGIKKFIGGNCTVSLMLMAIHGLVRKDLVEWIHTSTYQAASGAGAKCMMELLEQMDFIMKNIILFRPVLEIDKRLKPILSQKTSGLTIDNFGTALALNLIPWIDTAMQNGQTREEWKGFVETSKILGLNGSNQIKVDGTCVRVGSLRCHSQGLLIKLKQATSLQTVEGLIREANQWVELVPNEKEETIRRLTPAYVSGTLKIAIGRLRISTISPDMIEAFTVGDQLLWGAAEPLRRVLKIILETAKF